MDDMLILYCLGVNDGDVYEYGYLLKRSLISSLIPSYRFEAWLMAKTLRTSKPTSPSFIAQSDSPLNLFQSTRHYHTKAGLKPLLETLLTFSSGNIEEYCYGTSHLQPEVLLLIVSNEVFFHCSLSLPLCH